MANPHVIQVQPVEENALGHNGAQVALRNQPHEREAIHNLIQTPWHIAGRNDRVIVWTKGCGRVPDDERAIIPPGSDMTEYPPVTILNKTMVALINDHQPKGPRQPLEALLALERLHTGHHDIAGVFIPLGFD